ncbi:hypothetical_protein (plasmid) [Leishmania braziliensis MHOM/BR/75/M2904]|uniref:Hypothetical_protein n=1 Tax=Leishmania braziliensis MHOM/BR/75/M2904 TaxID=420245 RepID=A0A3P3YXC0_LEIBR|nr:hypothetical_protein [Leishmania braziliensis MHOM/BR/75/M2904]
MENATGDTQPLLLPTYTPVPSISADAVAHNAKVNTSTLSTSSDLLYRSVQLLRGNRRGPILFSTLARGRDAAAAAAAAAVSLNSLIVNFTLRNGVDLHAANATMSDALPLTPPQEVAWRSLFLSIPHTTLSPGPALANKDITAPRRRSSGGLFCC